MPGTEPPSLEAAYREHAPAVEALARRLCGPDDALDVTHEVFLRFARQASAFDPACGSLRAYLLGIGHHVAVDHLRSERARRNRQDRYCAGSADAVPDVSTVVARRTDLSMVVVLLDRLPDDERAAILAAFFSGRTYREVATLLGEAEGTIKGRIRRGLRRMHAIAAQAALTNAS